MVIRLLVIGVLAAAAAYDERAFRFALVLAALLLAFGIKL